MEEEIWKPIIDYEDTYEISTFGKVKSKKRNIILKPFAIKNNKHLCLYLSKNNKKKAFQIHRLVALHFIPNPLNLPYVRHLDDNPNDNFYKNLSWGTQQMNMDDKVKNNTQIKGEGVNTSILTEKQVREIREKYNKKTCNYLALSKIYNVNKVTIGDIIRRTSWKHI